MSDSSTGTKPDAGDSFRNFRKLCADIAGESSYLAKTGKVSDFLKNGPSGGKWIHYLHEENFTFFNKISSNTISLTSKLFLYDYLSSWLFTIYSHSEQNKRATKY